VALSLFLLVLYLAASHIVGDESHQHGQKLLIVQTVLKKLPYTLSLPCYRYFKSNMKYVQFLLTSFTKSLRIILDFYSVI